MNFAVSSSGWGTPTPSWTRSSTPPSTGTSGGPSSKSSTSGAARWTTWCARSSTSRSTETLSHSTSTASSAAVLRTESRNTSSPTRLCRTTGRGSNPSYDPDFRNSSHSRTDTSVSGSARCDVVLEFSNLKPSIYLHYLTH